MSLYDGLDLDAKEGRKDIKPDVSGWGSRSKLIETQKQLQAKKASLINLKKRTNITVAPVFDLKRRNDDSPLTFNMLTGKMERIVGAIPVPPPSPTTVTATTTSTSSSLPMPAAPFIALEAPGTFLGVTDEYDPLRPNDYETYNKKRKEQRQKERELERKKEQEERERRRHERHKENNYSDEEEDNDDRRPRRRRRDDSGDEERDYERDRDRERDNRDRDRDRDYGDRENGEKDKEKDRENIRGGGAAIAPPMSLIEQDNQVLEPPEIKPPAGGGEYGGGFNVGKGSVVSRMMAKMGYREGSGLGKSEQGMSTALQVEKTSKRGGKIIHEKDIPKVTEPPRQEMSNANLLKNPSKVLLLRNMVGPGEVDEDLEGETAEECQKYGKVTRCVIFEIPHIPEEEAVRIFVEFERQESAIKAVVDLNGRYFGGRMVKATFYNLDKFRRLDLADTVE